MPRFMFAAALMLATACTPALNWREMTVGPMALHATFPCKPGQVEHKTQLAPGREIVLHAVGCEAADASFVVVYGDVGAAGELAGALTNWKKASLAATKAVIEREQPLQVAGAMGLTQSALLRTKGQTPDGRAVQSQAAYFARGTHVIQAAVHAPALKPEMTEPFFAGLRFE